MALQRNLSLRTVYDGFFSSSELKKRPNLKEIKTKQFSKLPKAKRASTKKPINTSSVLSECVGEYHYELHIETWFSYVWKRSGISRFHRSSVIVLRYVSGKSVHGLDQAKINDLLSIPDIHNSNFF